MDVKYFLSIYAAVISTIVFLWRLYEFYDDKKGKLKVTLGYITEMPIYTNNKLGDSKISLVATITNVGKYKRLFERPLIETNKLVEEKKSFKVIDFNDTTNFPKSLDPGEKFEYKMPREAIIEKFIANGVDSVRTVVWDTHKKKYKSKWFAV